MQKTIIVTGGAGFIGGNFVHHCIHHSEANIITLDALTYAGNLDTLAMLKDNPRHKFLLGNIGDTEFIRSILKQYAPQYLINFAAESHVDRSIEAPDNFVKTNVLGTCSLLECVREYYLSLANKDAEKFRFLQVSTDEVYGSLGRTGRFTEHHQYAPNSPYSASKAASDHFVRAYHHTYQIPVLTTNCSNNYGPYQFPEKLIPLMILNALSGKELPIYGDGKNIRDWLYVIDHCVAIMTVLEKGTPGEVYNVGGDSEKDNLQVVAQLCDILEQSIPLPNKKSYRQQMIHVADRPGHDQRYAIDASKLKKLGWHASESFQSGLQKTVRWYLANTQWCQRVQDGSYQRERLGLAHV